jgi:hypothetical protein
MSLSPLVLVEVHVVRLTFQDLPEDPHVIVHPVRLTSIQEMSRTHSGGNLNLCR